jgi:iron complex outermembrane receptor protein
MRMFGACTDRMDPITSYAETSNLESISVSHGGNADLNANALGGALNLNLKEASFSGHPKTTGSIGSSLASNTSGFNLFGQLNHQNKRWGLFLQASTKNHGNYYAGGGQEVEFSQYQKINTTANFAYQLSKKEVLKVNFLYDKAVDVGYPSLPMDVGLAEATVAGVNYQNFNSGKYVNNWEAMAYINSIYHEMDDTKRPNVPIHMDMPGWSRTYGAWIKAESQQFGNHKLDGMVEYFQNVRRAEMTMYPENEIPMFMLTWPDVMRNSAGIGLKHTWNLNTRFDLVSSIRADVFYSHITTEFGKQHLEVFGYDVDNGIAEPIFSWKENLTYQLNLNTQLFTNFAYAERSPDVSELYGFFLFNAHDGYDYIGNPELHKEKAWQAELGITQSFKKMYWSFRGYFHDLNNYIIGRTDSLIDAMTIGANGVRVYTNIPHAQLMGFESKVNYSISKGWSVSANAQYTYGAENTSEPLPLIAPLQTRVKLNWQHNNWYANTEWQWANAQNRVNSNFGDIPTPAYSLINASIGKNWSLGKTQLKTELQGFNLLDYYYRNHLSWGQIPQMGRNITLNVILKL